MLDILKSFNISSMRYCIDTFFFRGYSQRKKREFYDRGIIEKIFDLLKNPDSGLLLMPKFLHKLKSLGLNSDDPRFTSMLNDIEKFKALPESTYYKGIDLNQFAEFTKSNENLIARAFEDDLVIPNWEEFHKQISEIFETCRTNEKGENASYIPQLTSVDPNNWACSICTVDGQRLNFGNYKSYFTIQSISKPFVYAIALNHLGKEVVHKYVGKEPSGRMFNKLILDYKKKPHNPMINSGAIVVCSLVHDLIEKFERKPSVVFENVREYFNRLGGNNHVGFNTSVYISEREVAYRNYALAFYLKEHKCFPEISRLNETLKFYFRCCSLDVTTPILAQMGATLANSGVNPITSDKVLDKDSVKNTLSLMYSCGLYDYSGEFAFEVGLPAKSGVSGSMAVAIPDVMGIGLWSPRLEKMGNSIRAIQFCRELVKRFPFHQYDNNDAHTGLTEPRRVILTAERQAIAIFEILSAAAKGRLHTLQKYHLYDENLGESDYDGRTALHIAAAEGHLDCVEFLLTQARVKIDPKDRWNKTPLEVAKENKHDKIVEYIENYKEPEVKNSKSSDVTKKKTLTDIDPDFNPLDLRSSDDPTKNMKN